MGDRVSVDYALTGLNLDVTAFRREPLMTVAYALSRNYLFITGAVLVVLGIGNALAAVSKVQEYRAVLTATAPQVQAATDFLFRGKQRYFPSEARERWDIAQAKLDFYHVVLSSGRLMLGLGLFCSAVALVRLRHQSPSTSARASRG